MSAGRREGGNGERRHRTQGRRASDEVLEYRLKSLEDLQRALAPATAQLARVDDALDSLEKLVVDERTARRQYYAELLEAMREVRAEVAKHKDEVTEALKVHDAKVDGLAIEQRTGRRTAVATVAVAVLALMGALATATAIVLSAGHHP